MPYGTINADIISTSSGETLGAGNATSFKNRIINGGMVIDQRNAGASITANDSSTQYSVDRWTVYSSPVSKFTVQQNAGAVTPPAGFTNYIGMTSTSAYTPVSSDGFSIRQRIEGYNVSDLGWGTANAKTVTLSFWVRSSLTGQFGGCLYNSAANRFYAYSYTINAANTWEQKSVTIAGDTTGTWTTTNATGLAVQFSLGAGPSLTGTGDVWSASLTTQPTGSTSVVGTNGATFYITGVQLEVGSQATSFDFRSYGTELALCQRYTYRLNASATGETIWANASVFNSTLALGSLPLPVTMRTIPTVTFKAVTTLRMVGSGGAFASSASSADSSSTNTVGLSGTFSGLTLGASGIFRTNDTADWIMCVAEL